MSEHVRGSLETTRQLAIDGDAIAQFQMGEELYEWEWCMEVIAWYRRSAEQGYAPALHKLSLALLDHSAPFGFVEEGKEKIWEEAVEWNAMARARGHAPAIYALAESYRNGDNFARETDLEKAIALHEQAVKLGYPLSQYELGVIYLARNSHQGDIDYALSSLIAAANSGLKPAQKALARAFSGGQAGVPQNVSMAREWLRQAANNTGKMERDTMLWLTHN